VGLNSRTSFFVVIFEGYVRLMWSTRFIVFLIILAGVSSGQSSDPPALAADAIMARVAANQDKAEALRKQYIYKQHIHIVTRKPNAKLMREETTDYRVVPTPEGTNEELLLLKGRYWHQKQYLDFTVEPVPEPDSLDASLVKQFRDDLANTDSKDGLGSHLFPLTTEQQEKYEFRLIGQEMQEGRSVYHIGFGPKDKKDYDWAGEAFIDATDFQPVRVFTKLSRRIPFVVRTMLGTDLPGIGFDVHYHRQEDGVWFPTSFGTEFRLHVLFFLNRDISVSLENTAFEHTHVKSKIEVMGPEQ
jgi:hypothetical protein